jgi:FtsZ-binding cell division protein ZapB
MNERIEHLEQQVSDHIEEEFDSLAARVQTLEAVIESNDILQDEVTRLRDTNGTLRVVIRTLRRTNESLRSQVEAAAENDDTFKRFCAGEFDAVVGPEDGVLPESADGGTAGLEL